MKSCCGQKPKLTAIQHGYRDDDCFYVIRCSKCGKKSGGKECYSEKDCVAMWDSTLEKEGV